MAQVHKIYQMIASALGQVPNYTGKETPDEYIQKITNIFESAGAVITATNIANANTFVDAQKCDILKSKMGINFLQYQQMIPIQVITPLLIHLLYLLFGFSIN